MVERYEFADTLYIKNAADADPQQLGEVIAEATAKAYAQYEEGEEEERVAEMITADAEQNRRHPFRRFLEMNDGVAAHRYRVMQVQKIIRSIRIVADNQEGRRAFVHVKLAGRMGNYRDQAVLASNLDFQIAALHRAERDFRAWAYRLREYKELCQGASDLADRTKEFLQALRPDAAE